jgi:hypothetical protein
MFLDLQAGEPQHPRQFAIPIPAHEALDESDAQFRVCAPDRAAWSPRAFDDHIKAGWNAVGRRNLKAGPGRRNVSDRTIKLGRFVAQNDLCGLEDALTKKRSFVLHGPDAPDRYHGR